MRKLRNKVVAIVGQGYVGLPLAMAAVSAGWTVLGIDSNQEKVAKLNQGFSHVEDVDSVELSKSISVNSYSATYEFSKVADAAVVILCVPTPLDENRNPDTRLLENAAASVGANLSSDTLVVSESTSYPGTLTGLIIPTIENLLAMGVNEIKYAVAPERVNPGDQVWNQSNTPRLIGPVDQDARALAAEFYKSFCHEVVFVEKPEIAEAAKLLENTFRLVNIGLANEFARICRAGGIDVHQVISAASTKPYGFMPFFPGVGVGGHCIPIDPIYLSWWAQQNGEVAQIVEVSDSVNLETPKKIASFALTLVEDKTPRILILGVSYKPGVADTRETPVSDLYNQLKISGANVRWHDPLVHTWEGTTSAPLDWECDLIIIAIRQERINFNEVLQSKAKILDCTNSFSGNKKVFNI